MSPRRILVLVHETLVPPESTKGYTEQQIDEWRTEYDVTTSLKVMGHEVRALGMGDNLADLRTAITDWKPDVAFNLLEEFQGIVTYDQYVVAFLELMRQPYTGCNPRGMMISRDKTLSKQILSYHRIPTARFALLPRNRRYRVPPRLKYPMFVKSATEDASLGISQASIVHDGTKLRERVQFIHEQTHSDALSNTSRAASSISAWWATSVSRRFHSGSSTSGPCPTSWPASRRARSSGIASTSSSTASAPDRPRTCPTACPRGWSSSRSASTVCCA
jgi:D-alanine-D-alanine ligase